MRHAPRTRWLLIAGLVWAAACGDDAVSDEDLIEQFIEDVGGPVDDAYVERALSYVDMSRHPLDVRVPHHAGVYDASNAPELVKKFKDGMRRRFYGSEIKVRSSRYEIDGERADVKLGLITTVGLLRADMALQKAGPGAWKLTKAHVMR